MRFDIRNPNSTYKIERIIVEEGIFAENRKAYPGYLVREYPNNGGSLSDACAYRFEALPPWMRQTIAVLNTAGEDIEIAGVGKRHGSSYWIESEGSTLGVELRAVGEPYQQVMRQRRKAQDELTYLMEYQKRQQEMCYKGTITYTNNTNTMNDVNPLWSSIIGTSNSSK